MKFIRLFSTLFFCLSICASYAQESYTEKKGMFSFGITLSDYKAGKYATDSGIYNTNQKGLFKSGKASFGFQVSYWRSLVTHIDMSGNLGVGMSNFPALFVKGDSIGQAGFSSHLDGLIHLKAFDNDATINPFLTAGVGAGYFGKQTAFYTPLGAGVEFHFNAGSIILLQGQLRKALSAGITNNFMFYSIGFAQSLHGSKTRHESHKDDAAKNSLSSGNDKKSHKHADKKKKYATEKENINSTAAPAMDTIASKADTTKNIADNITVPFADTDGDGVADKDDKCPDVKGSIENQGCPFPIVEGTTILAMSADSATYSVSFDFDQSLLQTGAFTVLNKIVQILNADNSLTINITGHADNQGTDQKNMQVSAERAKVTRDYFISYNIDPARITSSYYGASRPIDNVQQWRNRRVEVTVIKK